jgi:hypothetical protein
MRLHEGKIAVNRGIKVEWIGFVSATCQQENPASRYAKARQPVIASREAAWRSSQGSPVLDCFDALAMADSGQCRTLLVRGSLPRLKIE